MKPPYIHTSGDYASGTNDQIQIVNVHEITEEWSYSTLWNDKPQIVSRPCSFFNVTTKNTLYKCDITSLVKKWVANPATNYGVCLKMAPELEDLSQFLYGECCKTFWSSRSGNGPQVQVKYSTNKTLTIL